MTDVPKPIWPRWTSDDGIGSIEILDVFGNDLTVVNAARVSFAKESLDFDGKDEKLIKYLAKHKHDSPFFHPQIRLRIKMPIFMAREWFRHTVGFSRNEVSRRYVDSKPELWIPTAKDLRARDANLKQGSKDTVVDKADEIAKSLRIVSEKSIEMYESLLQWNVAPEIARVMLPQSMYTEFIETASLAAYARLIRLRKDSNAQKEIRVYADVLKALIEVFFPVSLQALLE